MGGNGPAIKASHVFLLLIAAVTGAAPIFDNDLFWTLATGRWIMEHGAMLPDPDPFTWTAVSRDVAHEWLTQVFLASVQAVAGLGALRILCGILTAGAVHLVIQAFRKAGAPHAVAVVAAAAWWLLVEPHAVLRPHLFGWIFFIWFAGYLFSKPDVEKRFRWIWMAAGMILWANAHGSIFSLPVYSGLMLVEVCAAGLVYGKLEKKAARDWAVITAFALAACLVQPAGFRLFTYVWETQSINQNNINEWMPLWHMDVWHSRPWIWIIYIILLGAFAALAIFRHDRRMHLVFPGVLPVCMGFVHSMSTRRMTFFLFLPLFFIVRFLPDSIRKAAGTSPWKYLAVIAVAGTLGLTMPRVNASLKENALKRGMFPEMAVAFLDVTRLKGHLFNRDGWGGFITWKLHPHYQNFLDGRWPVIGKKVLSDHARMTIRKDAERLFEAYAIEIFIEDAEHYYSAPPPGTDGWWLAWGDETAVVLVRKGPNLDYNTKSICRFYERRPNLRPMATWPVALKNRDGRPSPVDIPSMLERCSAPQAPK